MFDASSIVLAWDDYPIDQFPSLWDWIEERINAKDIVFSAVTLEEVSHVSSDCHDWLQDAGVESSTVNDALRDGKKGLAGTIYGENVSRRI